MKAWWNSLNHREQQLVMGLGIFFLLVILWRFAWIPWRDAVNQAEDDRQSQMELLLWMRRVVPVIQQARESTIQVASQDPLSTRVEKILAEEPLDRSKIELGVNQDGSVNMRLDHIVFDDLTLFMRTLAVKGAVTIESANLRRVDEGLVTGELVLR
jgi:general secretion pathway protein M